MTPLTDLFIDLTLILFIVVGLVAGIVLIAHALTRKGGGK
jgi:hypothetical protein